MNTARNLLTRSFPLSIQNVYKSSAECKVSSRPKLIVRKNFYKLKETQKMFQKRDGKPVWLKGGKSDKLLYQATWAATLIGVAMSLHTFYALSFAKTLFK